MHADGPWWEVVVDESDAWGPDPLAEPLTYPGRPLPWPALLVGPRVRRLEADGRGVVVVEAAGGSPSATRASGAPLDEVLADLAATGTAGRRAVLALGSNASPVALRRKFTAAGVSTVVVVVTARVEGLHVGHSAHVSGPGYVAAAARADATADVVEAAVVWADDEQVAALDATEPNYRRRRLPDDVRVWCAIGPSMPRTSYYASRWGLLGHGNDAWPLAEQHTTIRRLLAASSGVRSLTGPTVEGFVDRCGADAAMRAGVRAALAADGLVVEG